MRSEAELEERLSQPSEALVTDLRRVDGDILVIGAGGKLGPSLVRLAIRAAAAGNGQRVIAVSRFGQPAVAEQLRAAGAMVVSADIGAEGALDGLPDAPNVVYLVGAKFGTSSAQDATWYTNTFLPGLVAARFASSRIVALSTGNVYPFATVAGGGSTEQTPPDPVGEYAMSCLGRERILTRFAVASNTRLALIRLNYAVEMRYGVLVDIARTVAAELPVDVTMGHVNVVWQGYANEVILRSLLLADSPPAILNVTGPEVIRVRWLAERFGALLGAVPIVTGAEAGSALLSNASRCHQLYGYPGVPLGELVDLTAAWVRAGLPMLDKPTGFQRRDGRF